MLDLWFPRDIAAVDSNGRRAAKLQRLGHSRIGYKHLADWDGDSLKSVLAVERVSVPISEVLVANPRMAETLKFRGSPTIRINGRDIAGESEVQHFALSC